MFTSIWAFVAGLVFGFIFGALLGILAGWRSGATHAATSMLAHGSNLIKAARNVGASSDCAN